MTPEGAQRGCEPTHWSRLCPVLESSNPFSPRPSSSLNHLLMPESSQYAPGLHLGTCSPAGEEELSLIQRWTEEPTSDNGHQQEEFLSLIGNFPTDEDTIPFFLSIKKKIRGLSIQPWKVRLPEPPLGCVCVRVHAPFCCHHPSTH